MVELQTISGRLERGEIDGSRYLEELMRFVTAQIGCSRAALRLFVDSASGRILRTIAVHDAAADRMTAAPDIAGLDDSLYLARLQRDGHVLVTDTRADPLIVGEWRAYVEKAGISSVLDMACSVNGTPFGAFGCEQAGAPIEWSPRQLQLLRRIALRASLTLVNLVQTSVDTAPGALWETSIPNRLATMPMPLDPTMT